MCCNILFLLLCVYLCGTHESNLSRLEGGTRSDIFSMSSYTGLEIAKYFIVKTMIELSGQIIIFHQPRLP